MGWRLRRGKWGDGGWSGEGVGVGVGGEGREGKKAGAVRRLMFHAIPHQKFLDLPLA